MAIVPYAFHPKSSAQVTLAVLSSKGGVGKSTITAWLAVACLRAGLKVGVLDADILGPSIPSMFGMKDAIYAEDGILIAPLSQLGIPVMSSYFLHEEQDEPILFRAPLVLDMIRQFYVDTHWGHLDVLLIDMPPGTGDTALTVLQQLNVDGTILVSTPQENVQHIVAKGIRMLEKIHKPLIGLVENQAYYVCPHCDQKHFLFGQPSLSQLTSTYKTPLLLSLPIVSILPKALDCGTIESLDTTMFEPLVQRIKEGL
jgi:Mrp family chromosome partitioning ATPase